ncbi:hypothetical protein ABZ897_23015 [Nonomuraea sp. NPDC046802]|uniref:hypothetical protein n=1 Tax=Nonomuraea sp. NPDC046802 TaxID=3154919 RepID=UPI0033EE0918
MGVEVRAVGPAELADKRGKSDKADFGAADPIVLADKASASSVNIPTCRYWWNIALLLRSMTEDQAKLLG